MKKLLSLLACAGLVLGLSACGNSTDSDDKTITVGASTTPHAVILNAVKEQVEKEGYTLVVKEFDDYVIPNTALEDGELDANYFQHEPYLIQFNEDYGTHLVNVASIHFEPLGIYAKDATKENADFSIEDVKENDKIIVPDDATNEARALVLLEEKGIIKLKDGVGLKATKADIVENVKNVEILEVTAANIPTMIEDVAYACVNGNYALSGNIADKLVCTESKEGEYAKQYANIVAVKEGDEDSAKTKALVKVLTSKETKKIIEKEFGSLVIPVFS
ncbi:MAG: MetQ/NlpA family ABC transporter substrate-binding protein [Erysipelotrichia bacterium]|nr:MetQ/NlpA family ABC transporter substrate-binding protein [Erysipelotrichia bacterium]NCC54864.1 MetQ/NlpA family ABC transporter substrate-binding protein [Erysipelotrichia bacterium]